MMICSVEFGGLSVICFLLSLFVLSGQLSGQFKFDLSFAGLCRSCQKSLSFTYALFLMSVEVSSVKMTQCIVQWVFNCLNSHSLFFVGLKSWSWSLEMGLELCLYCYIVCFRAASKLSYQLTANPLRRMLNCFICLSS